ncbi:pyridoxal phosphate phosphatase PHOSPHO2-like [Bacillus rossius redtenbacheri]|uniref:pyridoxal phosphate phosphatase PHOSPHO2-like n=1 Tax=Bacillus rossius redtenbacheri TaxID=93214 RepID=UPI002FDD8BAB
MLKPILAAFDFNNTIVNGDSLQTIVELGASRSLPDVKSNYTFTMDAVSFTQTMIRGLQESKGITAEHIRQALRKLPLTSGLDAVLRLLKSRDCEVIIISDLMTVAIDDWLSGSEVSSLVDRVYANPAHYDADGYIVIEPYHRQDWCDKSYRHICKGHVLEEHVRSRMADGVSFDRLAFFGDGSNDLCPVLRLGDKDLAFPREGYKLMKLLDSNPPDQVKAAIHPWSSGEDIIGIFKSHLTSSEG